MTGINVKLFRTRTTVTIALVTTLLGCGAQKPPLDIFSWRVNSEQIRMVGDNEIYTISSDKTSRTFKLQRYAGNTPLWERDIAVAIHPQVTDISDNVSIAVAGHDGASRRISVLVTSAGMTFVRIFDQSGALLEQINWQQSVSGDVSQVFDAKGSDLYLSIHANGDTESHFEIFKLENSTFVQRFQRLGGVQFPTLQVANGEAVVRINQTQVIGLDRDWQQRWQVEAPIGVQFASSLFLGDSTTVIAQRHPLPGLNFIDQISGHVSFVPTDRFAEVVGIGADGNPYILEHNTQQVLKQISANGQVIFQSATTYDGAEGEIGAVKELSGGERVVVSFSDVSEGLFTFKGRSTIDWLRADGTKARSFTAVGDDRNYYGPDCFFCSSPDDRPGYHLNNVFIESDGDMIASGTFSVMTRWGSDSALWERVPFFGKVDPTKVDQ